MSLVVISKVGKKGTIYLPKHICEQIGINEGDKVVIKVEGDKLVLEFIPDPLLLALKVKKWAKTTVKDFEKESMEEQNELYTG